MTTEEAKTSVPAKQPMAPPAKQPLDMSAAMKTFKPQLKVSASTFVPSVKPVIEFSPQKGSQAEAKADAALPSVSKFKIDAPVFMPSAGYVPLAAPTPASTGAKKNKKKKSKKDKGEKLAEATSGEKKPENSSSEKVEES